jgi:hypothetical protein
VLIPWIVLYTDKTFNVPEASLHQASDSDHAQEMFLADNPNATVVWIVQTDDVNKAYDDYHNSEE